MTLCRNLTLFFVVFLPLSYATGVIANLFVGPIPPTRFGYENLEFLTRVLPLLLPSLLAVPVLHFGFRQLLGTRDPGLARWTAIVVTPITLLGVHVAFFGSKYWSPVLLVLYLGCGAIYGAVFGLVRRPDPS